MLEKLLAEFRGLKQKHLGYTALKDSDVLKALVFTLRLAHSHTSGRPHSRWFLDFLHEHFPEAQSSLAAAGEQSRIILP
ncbi:MAG: hypothetical protein WCC92_10600 [Candidatus Korobacteraceae bacterium]